MSDATTRALAEVRQQQVVGATEFDEDDGVVPAAVDEASDVEVRKTMLTHLTFDWFVVSELTHLLGEGEIMLVGQGGW